MINRLMLAAFMVTTLFVSAVRLPASACPASSPPIGQACKQGSCPNKACCAEAEKNKARPSSQPLVKDDTTAEPYSSLLQRSKPCSDSCLACKLGQSADSTPGRRTQAIERRLRKASSP